MAASNSTISGTPQTQAYNRYPYLVKCLREHSEEECDICQGPLTFARGPMFICFFESSHTCTPQEATRDWKNPVIPHKRQLLQACSAPTCYLSLLPPSSNHSCHLRAAGTGVHTKRTHFRSDDCPGNRSEDIVWLLAIRRAWFPLQNERACRQAGPYAEGLRRSSLFSPGKAEMAPPRPTSCPLPPGLRWNGTPFDSCSQCLSLRSSPPGGRIARVSGQG